MKKTQMYLYLSKYLAESVENIIFEQSKFDTNLRQTSRVSDVLLNRPYTSILVLSEPSHKMWFDVRQKVHFILR